jgi:hypothetical protein
LSDPVKDAETFNRREINLPATQSASFLFWYFINPFKDFGAHSVWRVGNWKRPESLKALQSTRLIILIRKKEEAKKRCDKSINHGLCVFLSIFRGALLGRASSIKSISFDKITFSSYFP